MNFTIAYEKLQDEDCVPQLQCAECSYNGWLCGHEQDWYKLVMVNFIIFISLLTLF